VKRDSGKTTRIGPRVGDLQFAGMVSAGLIATVLVLGALMAPVVGRNGHVGSPSHERDQTVRLSPPAPSPLAAVPESAGRGPDLRLAARRSAPLAARGTIVTQRLDASGPGAAIAPRGAPPQSEPLGASDGAPATRLPEPLDFAANVARDTDGDGLPDLWEIQYGLNPQSAGDAGIDSDHDGLDNLTELRLRTLPTGADSNGNGVSDGDEDADGDGLHNSTENHIGSDPTTADSNTDGVTDAFDDADGDGAPNLAEQEAGTDAGSHEDIPTEPVTPAPTPVAIEPDPDLEVDDGGSGAGTPPAPPADVPANPAPVPAPAPEPETPQAPAPPPAPDLATPQAPVPPPALDGEPEQDAGTPAFETSDDEPAHGHAHGEPLALTPDLEPAAFARPAVPAAAPAPPPQP
ncbi:MAG TPA: hypothetical protein VES79_03360, partial [Solirubrobacteraceae bacterium]|nr:hypothetical protein [Solirubrobacteraceae bacterium]